MTQREWIRLGLVVILGGGLVLAGINQRSRLNDVDRQLAWQRIQIERLGEQVYAEKGERQTDVARVEEALSRETNFRVNDDQALGRGIAALDTREAEHFKRSMRGMFR